MINEQLSKVVIDNFTISSTKLLRDVLVDVYLPKEIKDYNGLSLLLVNDGQDLVKMEFESILQPLYTNYSIAPLFVVAIHCAADRKNEYGTAKYLDYKGRGAKAALFNNFIFEELLPFIRKEYNIKSFKEKAYAGFSLGGLCALDIVWNHAAEFTKVGVFSGSLWWRDKDQEDADFDEDKNRIMHRQVREGKYAPWLNFFFEVGTKDETADRNNNGIIDAFDDTMALIEELTQKGYKNGKDIKYLELKDGTHDVATWASAFPDFLKWGWSINVEVME